MSDLVGTTLDRYEIVELIGEGGMATVYRARQPRLNRDVAIKVMLPDLAVTPNFRRRFELEAQAAANLRHPNILTVYDYGVFQIFGQCLASRFLPFDQDHRNIPVLEKPGNGEADFAAAKQNDFLGSDLFLCTEKFGSLVNRFLFADYRYFIALLQSGIAGWDN